MRKVVFLVSLLLLGCATQGVAYKIPENVTDRANVEISLSYSDHNHAQMLMLRGTPKCNKGVLFSLGAKTLEGQETLIAVSSNETNVPYLATLPAGVPIGLTFKKYRVGDVYVLSVVVILEPNKTYSISSYEEKRLDVIEKNTGLPAIFLPHDYFHRQLKCS